MTLRIRRSIPAVKAGHLEKVMAERHAKCGFDDYFELRKKVDRTEKRPYTGKGV